MKRDKQERAKEFLECLGSGKTICEINSEEELILEDFE
jgi:hypothetical protein